MTSFDTRKPLAFVKTEQRSRSFVQGARSSFAKSATQLATVVFQGPTTLKCPELTRECPKKTQRTTKNKNKHAYVRHQHIIHNKSAKEIITDNTVATEARWRSALFRRGAAIYILRRLHK